MMAKLGGITFKGASGKTYEFTIYSWGTTFKAVAAVYVITKRYKKSSDDGYTHTVLYVGETSDLSKRFDDHHKADCFEENGANCICIRFEDDQSTRLEIEDDLIKSYDPTCND